MPVPVMDVIDTVVPSFCAPARKRRESATLMADGCSLFSGPTSLSYALLRYSKRLPRPTTLTPP